MTPEQERMLTESFAAVNRTEAKVDGLHEKLEEVRNDRKGDVHKIGSLETWYNNLSRDLESLKSLITGHASNLKLHSKKSETGKDIGRVLKFLEFIGENRGVLSLLLTLLAVLGGLMHKALADILHKTIHILEVLK